jgi:hypothetical protein
MLDPDWLSVAQIGVKLGSLSAQNSKESCWAAWENVIQQTDSNMLILDLARGFRSIENISRSMTENK